MKGWREGKALVWVAVGLLALAGLAAAAQTNQGGAGTSAEERRVAEVLSAIAGAGKVEVALFYGPASAGFSGTEGGRLTGAVAVAEGARDMEVRLNLTRALRTLLTLPETAGDVFVMEDGR